MSNPFSSVMVQKPEHSRFDLSHDVKTTTDFKKVTPVLCQETLPGDTWRISSEVFLRTMPLVTPVMHNVNVYLYHFFVPNRIIWRKWEDFIKGGKDNKTDFQLPIFRVNAYNYNKYVADIGHLGDYLGLPKMENVSTSESSTVMYDINALPFIAYRMIMENYFMDENLMDLWMDELIDYLQDQNNCIITVDSTLTYTNRHGAQVTINLLDSLCDIGRRCWEHDYFTSSLPNTQRGDDVHLPIYGTAPLVNFGLEPSKVVNVNGSQFGYNQVLVNSRFNNKLQVAGMSSDNDGTIAYDGDFTGTDARVSVIGHTRVDLSAALGATINDFREALQLQRYNELVQRCGNRFKEWIRGIYGVNISDSRLDLPEYLGGGKAPIVISEVLQQSQTTDTSPQGNMSGRAVSASVFGTKKRFFEEHGFVISLVSVRPRSAYMQGVPKVFRKFDRFDYGLPIFAHLGEQAVKASEIYWAEDGRNDDTFGYLPRYSEYKQIPSQVTGEMRRTLKDWHLARYFSQRPVLNGDFVSTFRDDLERIFAVVDSDQFDPLLIQVLHHIRVFRPLPYYGTPI